VVKLDIRQNDPINASLYKTGCVGPLAGNQMSDLEKGLFYINIHSDELPAGEIRGQVLHIIGTETLGTVAEPEAE
jgi:CHRD domain